MTAKLTQATDIVAKIIAQTCTCGVNSVSPFKHKPPCHKRQLYEAMLLVMDYAADRVLTQDGTLQPAGYLGIMNGTPYVAFKEGIELDKIVGKTMYIRRDI